MNKVYNTLTGGHETNRGSPSLFYTFKGIASIAIETDMSLPDLEQRLYSRVNMRVSDVKAVDDFLAWTLPWDLVLQLIHNSSGPEADEVFDWARKHGHLRVCLLADQLIRDILG